MMVVLTAFAAQIRHENNELETKNEALQGEVDTLSVKIKSANSIDHIEKVATKKLGMVHPSEDECVNLSDKDKPKKNFAAVIRKEAKFDLYPAPKNRENKLVVTVETIPVRVELKMKEED